MKKIITICDYCGKQVESGPRFIQTGTELDESSYETDERDFRLDFCQDCFETVRSCLIPEILRRKPHKEKAAGTDPEEDAAPPDVPQQDDAEVQQEKTKKQQAPADKVDHGRIVALYTANPPRSIKWIADDCKCSEQTVINHLKREGIYRTLQEQRKGKQEE